MSSPCQHQSPAVGTDFPPSHASPRQASPGGVARILTLKNSSKLRRRGIINLNTTTAVTTPRRQGTARAFNAWRPYTNLLQFQCLPTTSRPPNHRAHASRQAPMRLSRQSAAHPAITASPIPCLSPPSASLLRRRTLFGALMGGAIRPRTVLPDGQNRRILFRWDPGVQPALQLRYQVPAVKEEGQKTHPRHHVR